MSEAPNNNKKTIIIVVVVVVLLLCCCCGILGAVAWSYGDQIMEGLGDLGRALPAVLTL